MRGYPSGEPIPVSSSGGAGPVWSRDRRTLFFESAVGWARVDVGPGVGGPRHALKLAAAHAW